MKTGLLALWLLSCSTEAPVEHGKLHLEGDRTHKLVAPGTAPLPKVLHPGGKPMRIRWTSEHPDIARVQGKQVVAVSPGKTTLTGTWRQQTVQWNLIIVPPVHLRIIDPPPSILVGETQELVVQVGREPTLEGGQAGADLGQTHPKKPALVWTSTDPTVATVDDQGVVTARAAGWTFISAEHDGSKATTELKVRAPDPAK